MFDNPAAVWSAVAATFAALSSFLIMLTQRRNLLESVRPELVLTDWGRREAGSNDTRYEEVIFGTIRNVGRGAAIHVLFLADEHGLVDKDWVTPTNPPTDGPFCGRIAVLAPNETIKIDGRVSLWWKNVKETQPLAQVFDPGRQIWFTIVLCCWDTRGLRHETHYTLYVQERTPWGRMGFCGDDEVAPGVVWAFRKTSARAGWLLKWQHRVVGWSIKMRDRTIALWIQLKALCNKLWDKTPKPARAGWLLKWQHRVVGWSIKMRNRTIALWIQLKALCNKLRDKTRTEKGSGTE
jgi:hypothetical protein